MERVCHFIEVRNLKVINVLHVQLQAYSQQKSRTRERIRMKAEVQLNVFYDDLDSKTEPVDLTSGESREKTEVNVRRLDEDSLGQYSQAKSDELDQWNSNGTVSVCGRAGIPVEHMRWICTCADALLSCAWQTGKQQVGTNLQKQPRRRGTISL